MIHRILKQSCHILPDALTIIRHLLECSVHSRSVGSEAPDFCDIQSMPRERGLDMLHHVLGGMAANVPIIKKPSLALPFHFWIQGGYAY